MSSYPIRFSTATLFILAFSATLFAATGTGSAHERDRADAGPIPAHIIRGTVADAETGESLPAANIQVLGTYRGTITNMEGHFELPADSLPVTIVVRYIGYATRQILVDDASSPVDVRMQPVTIEMQEVVVTGKDPALGIMERVIARKQLWRRDLNTYIAEAYTRQRLENDQGIVSITESVSRIHWDRERGTREVLKSRRQTNNLAETQNFAAAGFLPNLYDDDIEIAGYRIVGVTHPNALSYYDFKIEGLRNIDDQLIYDIRVIPKRRLQPVFEGMVSVLAGEYALLEVDLKPGPAVMFPPPIREVDLHYRQQFSNFGGNIWLPVDMRIEGMIDIGFVGLQFPKIRFAQISSVSEYNINAELPDSLFRIQRMIVVDTLSTRSGKTLEELGQPLPLTLAEQQAYEEVDSTLTLQEAFRPTGFLAGMVTVNDSENGRRRQNRSGFSRFTSNVEPDFRYNRVDAAHFGLAWQTPEFRGFRSRSFAGYSTGSAEWDYGSALDYRLPGRGLFGIGRTRFAVGYRNSTASIGAGGMYKLAAPGVLPLFGAPDYYDYFRNEKAWFSITQPVRSLRSSVALRLNHESHRSAERTTSYSIPGGYIQPLNPAVPEGDLRSGEVTLRIGQQSAPFGVAGQNHLALTVEHSDPDLLGGDYRFTRYSLSADLRVQTFYKRRLIPNALDLHLAAGTYSGDLPVQRYGLMDGSLAIFRPFGSIRSLTNRPLLASQYAFVFWEHNFRSIPFEALGMYGAARRGLGIVVHGVSGYVHDSSAATNGIIPVRNVAGSGYHHELGASLNGIFGVLRLDATFRLDQPGFTAGIGLSRFF